MHGPGRGRRTQAPSSPLLAGGTHPIQVRCLTKYNGFFRAVVVFDFAKESGEFFSIGRSVAAIAQSQLAKELGPTSSFEPYQANLQRPVTVITEEGVPPVRYGVGPGSSLGWGKAQFIGTRLSVMVFLSLGSGWGQRW